MWSYKVDCAHFTQIYLIIRGKYNEISAHKFTATFQNNIKHPNKMSAKKSLSFSECQKIPVFFVQTMTVTYTWDRPKGHRICTEACLFFPDSGEKGV